LAFLPSDYERVLLFQRVITLTTLLSHNHPPVQIDLELESGEYFLSATEKLAKTSHKKVHATLQPTQLPPFTIPITLIIPHQPYTLLSVTPYPERFFNTISITF
jgi:hypothetical protein